MAPTTDNDQVSDGRSPDQPHGVGQARVSLLTTALKADANYEDPTSKEDTLKGGNLTYDSSQNDPFKKDPFKTDMPQAGAFKEDDSSNRSDTPREAGQRGGSAPTNIKYSGAQNTADNDYYQFILDPGAQSEAMLRQGCEGLPPSVPSSVLTAPLVFGSRRQVVPQMRMPLTRRMIPTRLSECLQQFLLRSWLDQMVSLVRRLFGG